MHHRAERRRQIDVAQVHRRIAASLRRARSRCAAHSLAGRAPREITRLGVAYVPQEHNIFPTMSVRENLEMGGYVDPQGAQRTHRQR